ncbi:S41 family peptidase [Erythrobacter sp.]|uniref:S41 family peptidase n=1 Tax=Erythrobacter sp. TaxID=1042 RepID=UPI0025F397CE|nr:S41 family peptidase [Erythrobacter sp.]
MSLSTLGTKLRTLLECLDGDLASIYQELGLDYRPRFTPVMRTLSAFGTATVKKVADNAGISHSAASQTVTEMKKAGLVTTEPGEDARERVVSLTDSGREALPLLERQWEATTRAANALNAELSCSLDAVADEAIAALSAKPFRERILAEKTRMKKGKGLANRIKPHAFVVGLLGFLTFWDVAAHAQPATAIDEIAEVIAENYFDPATGARVANDLRLRAGKGEFDNLTRLDLAAKVTSILAAVDGHFRVDVMEQEKPIGATGSGPIRYSFEQQLAHQGWGFRQVRILPGNVGYIGMTNFAHIDFANESDAVKAAVDSVLKLVEPADGLIIDLRDNGGGAPSLVGYLVSAFTPRDAEIYNTFRYRAGQNSEAPAQYYQRPELDEPLFILTSSRTASAAEALPYTLQAAGRAVVVGETSAGKANPGRSFETPGGFSVFVSTGAPINPITLTNWEGRGVVPDIPAASDEALVTAQGAMISELLARGGASPDAEWALAALTPVPVSADVQFAGQYGDWAVRRNGASLILSRGKYPPVELKALGESAFFETGNPSVQYHFILENGRATAVERRTAFGSVARQMRNREPLPAASSAL